MYEDFFDKEFNFSFIENSTGRCVYIHICKHCYALIHNMDLELHARWHINRVEMGRNFVEKLYPNSPYLKEEK